MAHNTNVTALGPPYGLLSVSKSVATRGLIHLAGGFPKFMENGLNDRHLALWMQQSGYNTYYAGKLFNSHNIGNYNDPPMSGYTGSEFFLEPYTYQVCALGGPV